MKIENAAIVLLLLGMLITVLCGGINLYRLCHSLPYLPHWWSMFGYASAGDGVQLFRTEQKELRLFSTPFMMLVTER